MRLAVLEFENTVRKRSEERLALVRFRLKKTVPRSMSRAPPLLYYVQAGNKVLVAVAPAEVIAQYEAPFRSCSPANLAS